MDTRVRAAEFLKGTTGKDRRHWRNLIHRYGIDAVKLAFDYANEREWARPSTYSQIESAMWESDFYGKLQEVKTT